MRFTASLAAILSAFCPMATASAQTASLVGGQTYRNVVSYACFVDRGPTTFQRNGTANKAYVTIANLWAEGLYELSGQATLVFASATTGRIYFKNTGGVPVDVAGPRFAGYSQTYSAALSRLVVSYLIVFPTCNLGVTAVYDGA